MYFRLQDVSLLSITCNLQYADKTAILLETTHQLVSDANWLCTSEQPASDWYDINYDDRTWPNASVVSDSDAPFTNR